MAIPIKTILQKVKRPDFFPNHYEILGVNDFGTYNSKRKLYRLQENKNEVMDLRDQTKLTRLINQADKVLKDPTLRSKYDQQLREYLGESHKAVPTQGDSSARKRAATPKADNSTNKDQLKTTSTLLGVMNVFGTLGVIYLNLGVFSWYYSLYIAFMAIMISGLLKALSLKSLSEVVTEDNGGLFLLAGIFYFLYNQELLILASLSVITLLLIKVPIIQKSSLLLKTAPVICSLLFFLSVWAVPSLNEKYFPEYINSHSVFPPIPPKTIIKDYVEVYGKWNIREVPNGKKMSTTIPGQIYEILGVTNTDRWYQIVTEQDTGVIHLTQQKGRFFQDTVLIKQKFTLIK